MFSKNFMIMLFSVEIEPIPVLQSMLPPVSLFELVKLKVSPSTSVFSVPSLIVLPLSSVDKSSVLVELRVLGVSPSLDQKSKSTYCYLILLSLVTGIISTSYQFLVRALEGDEAGYLV